MAMHPLMAVGILFVNEIGMSQAGMIGPTAFTRCDCKQRTVAASGKKFHSPVSA